MNLITVENISKSYVDKKLFENITFGIHEGQRIGLIGVNGTGKTTLLKVIAGIIEPDSGKRVVSGQAVIEYLSQNPIFEKGSTVLEQVFNSSNPLLQLVYQYEMTLKEIANRPEDVHLQKKLAELSQQMDSNGAWELESNAKGVLIKLGIKDFNMNVEHLSGGQRKRVALARALIQPSDLLILDEPTNHIDNDTVEWLEEYLGKWKGALLLITHDRYFLNRVVNNILELDEGNLYSYEGNYEQFLEKKAEREENNLALQRKHASLYKKELAWMRRGARARTTKQKARIERFEDLQNQSFKTSNDQVNMALGASRLGRKVLELKDIHKSYGDKNIIHNFSYVFKPGDRIGIIGRNGLGKSTLLNIIAGKILPDSGEIEIGQTVKMAYYDQESEEMDPEMRVIDYVKEAGAFIKTEDGSKISASQMLERFLFTSNAQWAPIGKLSGGERRRLYLLKKLVGEPNVLLLDEPTNDLDIQTLTILEDYLDHFPGTVIIVSHDRYFLDRTVGQLLIFEGQGSIDEYTGNYSDYVNMRKVNKVEERNERPTTPVKEETEVQTINKNAKPVKLSYKDQREYDEIEAVIADIEKELEDVAAKIEGASNDFVLLQEYLSKQSDLEQKLELKMKRWMELIELVEEIEKNKEEK